ncbi:MAG: hypothetical protein ACHQII_08435, partial [Bacteroidia bacterium]
HSSVQDQEIIVTTCDKMELILIESNKFKSSKEGWIAPLSIFLSIVAVLITADFKDLWGMPKDSIRAFFFMVALASLFWLLFSIYNLVRYWEKGSVKWILVLS